MGEMRAHAGTFGQAIDGSTNTVFAPKNRYSRISMFRLKYLLLLVLCVLIYSYNYHFLWILYDVVVIVLGGYYLQNKKLSLRGYQWFIIILTLWYFVSISVYSGHTFIGLLSTWDTFKHILIFLLLSRMFNSMSNARNNSFMIRLYHFIFAAILMQMVFVFYQVRTGVFFDNVAGTFGDGATHSMAYLSILFVLLSIILKKNILLIAFSILVSVWLNMAGEDVSFFVLLPILLFGVVLNRGIKIGHIFVLACIMPIIIAILGHVVVGNIPYKDVILSRVSGFVLHDHINHGGAGRGNALVSAINRGGWFGNGPGSFSNIYLMNGYDFDPMDDPTQINIAESSHLIFESGVTGLILALMTYSSLLWGFFEKRRNKLFAIAFFGACMFDGSLLMTETQIFLFLIIMFVFKQFEYDKIYKCNRHSVGHIAVHKIRNAW